MIKRIKASERYHLDGGWLSAYWLFSFDHYYDPQNVGFGPLRVFNHDRVAPASGFPLHPHREMEIVTYVLEGELTHEDSTGGRGVIGAGEVQRMTAGTGIRHAEINASRREPVKLMQIWVLPAKSGLEPSYEQKRFTLADRAGRLLAIASGQGAEGAVKVNQDTTFYVSRLEPGERVGHEIGRDRRAFLYLIEGAVEINGERYEAGDQARVTEIERLEIEGLETSELILIDLP